MAGEAFASAGSDLVAAPTAVAIGAVPVAPQPTGGQGLALDPTGHFPASLIKGYPNDKTKALLGDGSWGATGGELSYVEHTANVTISGTTEAAATTIATAAALTFDGSTTVLIECFVPVIQLSVQGTTCRFVIYEDSGSIGGIAQVIQPASGVSMQVPVYGFRRRTPAAGSHTYSFRAFDASAASIAAMGSGGSGSLMPGFIRVSRV